MGPGHGSAGDRRCREDRRRDGRSGERGQVLPLMAASVVVAGALAFGVVHLAIVATERARAQSAADASALAAAADDRAAGGLAAAANGARLEVLRTVGTDVLVRVRFRRATARARARLVPDAALAGPGSLAVTRVEGAGP